MSDETGGETGDETRFEAIEIKLSELEHGQAQIDGAVRRHGEDLRRLTDAIERLGTRLEAALGERDGPGGGPGGGSGSGTAPDDDPDAAPASPTADPERPPHYSGPA